MKHPRVPFGISLLKSSSFVSFCIVVIGLLAGTGLIAAIGKNPSGMYQSIVQVLSGFDISRGTWNSRYIGEWLAVSTPLILCGLSMGFAARVGLFNIGAEGQYIVGIMAAQGVALSGLHWSFLGPIPAILAAIAAGAVWGGLVGFLKAKYAVSEVVSTIMLNYVALFGQRWVTLLIPGTSTYKTKNFPAWFDLNNSWLSSITNNSTLNNGIFLMIIAVILYAIIMEKSALGFSFRATGFNKDAARCSGINVGASIVISMAISGAFAGLAGGIVSLGSFNYGRVLSGFDNYGFNGIAVALVGNSNAFGMMLSGLFFGMLQSAQPLMQSRQIAKEIVWIINGLVVILIALRPGLTLLLDLRAKRETRKAAQLDG